MTHGWISEKEPVGAVESSYNAAWGTAVVLLPHTHTAILRIINRYNEIVYVRKSAMRWLWRCTRTSSPDKGESVTGKRATRTRASLSLSLSLSLRYSCIHTHTHVCYAHTY